MKKKLLLAIAMVALFVCIFAISVSAATETIDGITYSLNNGYASVTNANKSCTLETVIIPNVVTGSDGKEYKVNKLENDAFRDNKNIKYVSLSENITSVGGAAFYNCSNLVFIDFNDNPNNISFSWGTMRGCNSLKAICFSDGIKAIGDQFLTGAQSLTAVYLPASLETIKGNKSAGDGPAFGNCPNLYFVNEKFEVRDENGNFYTAETFEMPARPDVYFFPSNLKAITGPHNISETFAMDEEGMAINTSGEDCAIYNCPNINPILVMPESYKGYDDRVVVSGNAQFTDHRGDTISNGLFQRCGTADKPLTVVWLGKIDRVSMGRKGEMSYTTYVFANPANTSFENTKIGTWYNTSDAGYGGTEMYAVFCYGNGGLGVKYSIKFAGSADNNKYPVLQSTVVEGAETHMVNPNAKPYDKEPTCTTDRMVGVLDCFCGNPYSFGSSEPGTALGHDYDVMNGAIDNGMVYSDYFAAGTHSVACARCSVADVLATDALFIWKGYSASTYGTGYSVVQGFYVNKEAVDAYLAYAPDFNYGILATVNATDGAIAPKLGDGNVLTSNFDKAANDYLDIKVTGIPEGYEGTKVVFCVYVTVGEKMYYLDNNTTGETITGISYSEVVALNNN